MGLFLRYAMQAFAVLVFVLAGMALTFFLGVSAGYAAHVRVPMAERMDQWAANQDAVARGENENLVLQAEALKRYRPDVFLTSSMVVGLVVSGVISLAFLELWWRERRSLLRQDKQPNDGGARSRPDPAGH